MDGSSTPVISDDIFDLTNDRSPPQQIRTDPPLSTGQYDRYNRNGVEICHAVKCRRYAGAIRIFRGFFCPLHVREMSLIREKIKEAKRDNDRIQEQVWRQREFELRKFLDEGHMTRMHHLETQEL